MNLESEIVHDEPARRRSADTVSGYLAALAMFASAVGIAWHPLRLDLPAMVIALVAAGMGSGRGRLQFVAVLICAVCLFLGLTVAVATSHPLW